MTVPPPTDVPSLMAALKDSDPGRPRLTWYGPAGERVELSARVLDNWVAKTANLLVEELDAGPGTRVRLDLPPHWRTAVWALAVWAVGAELSDDDSDADVLVSTGAGDGSGRLVLVTLPALARGAERLPPGALDYNAEVSGFGDVFVPDSPTRLETTPISAGPGPHGAPRLLVTPRAWDPRGTLLGPLLADGSVVLCHTDDAASAAAVAAQERVTETAPAVAGRA